MNRQEHDNESVPQFLALSAALTPSQSQDANRTQRAIYWAAFTSSTIKHSGSFTFAKVIKNQKHQKQAQ
jgi:hypothetical protein